MMPSGSDRSPRVRACSPTFHQGATVTSRSASVRTSTALAIWSSGSSTRSNSAGGSQRATTNSQLTILPSFSLHQSGYGCALMSPRPSHFIRWHLKLTARTAAEWEMLDKDTVGIKSELESNAKTKLESLLHPSWFFNCPICGGLESLVAELDFHSHDVVMDRCACVECGFVVGKGAPYISQVILADQLTEKR